MSFITVNSVALISSANCRVNSGVAEVSYVEAEVGVSMVTTGATVSRMTVIESVPVFPAGSLAVTVIGLSPSTSGTGADQEVVPVAVPLAPVAAFDHRTLDTVRSSLAVPLSVAGVVVVDDLPQAVAGARLVQESVIERYDVKKDIFRQIDRSTEPDVMLASSSSSVSGGLRHLSPG